MPAPLSRLALLLALAIPFALAACDATDPAGQRPLPNPNDPGAEEPEPLAIDVEALNAVFDCDVTVAANDEGIEAELGEAACTLDDGRAVAYYAFTVEAERAATTVSAASAWFDTVLYLYGADGAPLAENDDVDPFDTNSRIEAELDRGVYVAAVSSFGADTGAYRFLAKR